MSVTNESPIAIGISLASNASPQQVAAAIDLINRVFGVQAAPGVAPAVAVQQGTTIAPITDTASVLVDSSGMPWDERIHSSAKSQKNDGTWTKRKGVDDATYARISTELRTALGATPSLPAPGTAPTLPSLPQTGPVLPALPSAAPSAYQNFVAWVGTLLHSPQNPTGRLTGEWVDQLISANGVPGGLANLSVREDLIPALEGQIKQALGL
jgi:hypothetical protein